MSVNSFINGDCMDYLPWYPDDYFDLAIVDPPYGAGFTETGGCKGWFSKYHQNNEKSINGGGIGTGSAGYSTDTSKTSHLWITKKKTAITNSADERKLKTGKKNHSVGRGARERVF